MSMDSIKGVLKIEVLDDPTDADALKRAKRRWGEICESPDDAMIAKYNQNEGGRHANPGVPDEDYGEIN